MFSPNSKGKVMPNYSSYFNDPALVKAFYIPTEPRQLSEKQKEVSNN